MTDEMPDQMNADLQRLFSADFDTPDVNKLVRTHLGAIFQGLAERIESLEDTVEELVDAAEGGGEDAAFWEDVSNRAIATLHDCAALFDGLYKRNGWLGQDGLTSATPKEFRDAFTDLAQRIGALTLEAQAGPTEDDEEESNDDADGE